MANNYPFTWKKVPAELEIERQKHFTYPSGVLNGVVSEPLGIHSSQGMIEDNVGERVFNFKLRPDDIWIITYPKCGTTWCQVIFQTSVI